jgi:hypothetical protein
MIATCQGEDAFALPHSSIMSECSSRFNCIYDDESPMDIFMEPENRVACLYTSVLFKAHYKSDYRSGVPSIFFAVEDIAPTWWGFNMTTVLKDILTLKVSQLHEAGIIERDMYFELKSDTELKPEKIGPQVLTLPHLAAGFVMILFLLLLSIAVFAVEFVPKLWMKLLAWLQRAVFCCVVVKFTRMNKLM